MLWEEGTDRDGGGGTQAQRVRGSVICIISPRRFTYSETFIQAHIQRLPAEVRLLQGM
jgi:hypothetical protein